MWIEKQVGQHGRVQPTGVPRIAEGLCERVPCQWMLNRRVAFVFSVHVHVHGELLLLELVLYWTGTCIVRSPSTGRGIKRRQYDFTKVVKMDAKGSRPEKGMCLKPMTRREFVTWWTAQCPDYQRDSTWIFLLDFEFLVVGFLVGFLLDFSNLPFPLTRCIEITLQFSNQIKYELMNLLKVRSQCESCGKTLAGINQRPGGHKGPSQSQWFRWQWYWLCDFG